MHPGAPPPPPPQPPAQPPNQVGATLPILVGGLALLLIVGVIAGAMLISSSLENDDGSGPSVASSPSASPLASATATATTSASPSPEPSTSEDPLHDSCLIGTWQETSHDSDTTIEGVRMRLHSWGATQHFKANGRLTVDYGDANNARAKVVNTTYEVISSGILTYNWQTSQGQILYSNAKGQGTVIYRKSGRETSRVPLSGSIDPERYTCSGDSLREFGPTWTIELRRVNTAPL
jgi:hypothetical protein